MKLHLPKALCAAVLAAVAGLTTAWGATTVESKTLTSESATYNMENANVIIGDLTVESGVTGTVNFAATNWNTQIDHLNVVQEEGATTKLTVRAQTCDLLIIDDLTGAGQIEFNRAAGNADWGYSVLLKDSDETTPTFTGTLSLQNSNVANNGNSMHLYLMSENAAKDATIELRQRTTLAVSTSTAKIAGLQGTHNQAAVISFANPNGTTGKDVNFDTNTGNCYNQNNSRDTNDGTERTLVLTGSGEYSYAGRIGSGDTNNTLNLKVAMGEGGKQTLTGTNFLKKLTVTSGELVLSGNTTVATYTEGNYTVQNGTLTISGSHGGTASFGNVTVKEGGTLKLVSTDATGWSNHGTASILLQGNGDNLATLALGNRQTTSIDITLAGSSRITSTQTNESDLDMFGGKISASGTNNVINAAISTRADVEIAVADGGTLEVNGKIDKYGRTDGGAGTVTKSGAGTLTLNGTGSLFRNGIVVNGGELVFGEGSSSTIAAGKTISIAEGATVTVDGTLSLGGGLSGAGTFTTADGAALHVGGATSNADIHHAGGDIVFDGTLTMGEGKTLYLGSGFSVDIDDLSGFSSSGAEYVDARGNRSTEAHGFAEGTFSLVTGGTIDGSRTYTLAGQEWTLDNDHRTFSLSGAESRTSYLMMTGNEDSLSAIQTASEGHLSTVIMNGGTLAVDSALEEGQSISIQGASTLSITEGTALDKASVNVSGGTVTLTGAGEYVLGSSSKTETLADGWTGIISVSGTKDAINLNNFANANSKIRLNGLAGWMAFGVETTKELIIGTDAGSEGFKITAMSDNKTYKFSGKISGHGVFEVGDNNNATGDTVEFSGDVSGWDGTLKYNVNGTNAKTLKFSGSATTVNVGIENAAGTATVEFANGNAVTVNSTFSGSGTTNLKLTGNGAKKFSNTLSVNNVDAAGGTVTFDKDLTATGSISVGADTTMNGKLSLANGQAVTIAAGKTLTHDGFTYTAGDTAGSISKVSDSNTDEWSSNTDIISAYYSAGTTISNLVMTKTANEGKTVNFALSGVDFVNAGTGVTTLAHDGNQLASLDVQAGSINVTGGLTVAGDTTLAGDTSISIAKDVTFATGNETIASLNKTAAATISGSGTVSVTTEGLTYSNADITLDASGLDAAPSTKATLSSSKLTVTGTKDDVAVEVNVKEGTTNDFDASSGSITVNAQTANIGTAEVGAGKSLTIGDGTGTATITTAATVAGTLAGNVVVKAAEGTTENAVLSVGSDNAEVSGNVTISSTGTLVLAAPESSAATIGGILQLDASSTIDLTNITVTPTTSQQIIELVTAAQGINVLDATKVTVLQNFGSDVTWSLKAGDVVVGGSDMPSPALMSGDASSLQLVIAAASSPDTLTATVVANDGVSKVENSVLTLKLNDVDLTDLTGVSSLAITIEDGAWSGIVGDATGEVTLELLNSAGAGITIIDGTAITINGYKGESNGKYDLQYIPEPTTATLSLLALAGLAARRRRKH